MARALLAEGSYHCSGSDTLLGSANVGASIFILLLIGWVVGAVCSALFFLWRESRRRVSELPWNGPTTVVPDIDAVIRAAQTPTIRDAPKQGFRDGPLTGSLAAKPVTCLESGPLKRGCGGLGVWPQEATEAVHDSGSIPAANSEAPTKGGALGADAAPTDAAANVFAATQSPGQPLMASAATNASPFPGVPAYDVMTNPVMAASLEGLPRKLTPLPAGMPLTGGSGQDFVITSAAFNPLASSIDCMEAGLESLQSRSPSRSPSPVQPRKHPRVDEPNAAGAAAVIAVGPLRASVDVAARQGPPEPAPPVPPPYSGAGEEKEEMLKQERKQELLSAVRLEAYSLNDLDAGWRSVLDNLDRKLQVEGGDPMSDRERAIAIRSLVVATSSQSAEEALDKAAADVKLNRAARQMMVARPT